MADRPPSLGVPEYKLKRTLVLLTIGALLVALGQSGVSAGHARVDGPARGYSIARYSRTGIYGAETITQNRNVRVLNGVGFSHGNDVSWLQFDQSGRWIEMGIRNGYDPNVGCGSICYEHYRGENLTGAYARTVIQTLSPNGATVTFRKSRMSVWTPEGTCRFYRFYRDGAAVGDTPCTTHLGALHDVGGEFALDSGNNSSQAEAATFDHTQRVQTSEGGAFQNWNTYSSRSIVWGSHYSGCDTGVIPHCFNGVPKTVYNWSWNKPR